MPNDVIWAGALVAMVAMICLAAVKGWRGWLELRRFEISQSQAAAETPELTPAVRIEVAHLKERLRKLEAIATGIDV